MFMLHFMEEVILQMYSMSQLFKRGRDSYMEGHAVNIIEWKVLFLKHKILSLRPSLQVRET